ncbi:hypothetical protein WJX72_002771 [[Myrmecia] bisecta]|uniref:EF-hand domain-containing protein n=1 Tax=[Myrmecia] bisecta TaxID=41462 RepID=A0AAW1QEK0_9CHLO
MADPLLQWFQAVDADRSGSIDAQELQKALALGNLNFSLTSVAHMIRIHDQDHSGNISFPEFKQLHNFLTELQQRFTGADVNRQGRLPLQTVQQLLNQTGYRLDQGAASSVLQAFDADRDGLLGLPEFIAINLFMRSATATFQAFDQQRRGAVTLDYNQFVYAASNVI